MFRNLLPVVLAGLMLDLLVCRACSAEPAAGGAESPFTCLFDTAVPQASPLAPEALGARKGWAVVAEDTLSHPFAGDAVLMNDRVAVVLRRNADGAEVYSRLPGGGRQRATLVLLGSDGAAGAVSSVRIIENSQAAVMLEAAVVAKSGATATFRFRLTAGESLLDVRGGEGASRVRVCDQSQYVVVPDFFADDMVFDPAAHQPARIGLAAENSVLGLAENGDAIVACVWRSSRQNADLLLAGEGATRRIAGYEIDLPADNRLWIAVMEGAGIWHARRVTGPKATDELALEWKPPMPARWRTDFVRGDGTALSTYFADPQGGPEPENAMSNGSCRFDGGRALVRMTESIAAAAPSMVVVYPVERTRATPLAAFCLVDVMRNALGVGPCQYVLDAEGLGDGESPTPDQVTHWVEKQFEKKVSKRDVDAIREQLTRMSVQVKRTDERIGTYVGFVEQIEQACSDEAKIADHAVAAKRLGAIVRGVARVPPPASPVVEKLAAEVAARADREDALATCQLSLSAIRTAGATQDYALARLRMAARRLKQESRTLAISDPPASLFAGQVQQQAEQMLVKK